MIRNYLGFPRGISGGGLAHRAWEQALLFGAEFVFTHDVIGLTARGDDRVMTLDDGSHATARAVIVATGVTYRRLNIPAVDRLIGAGVFYGAPGVEAAAMTGEHVCVVGGANSAGQAALHLARFASRVTMLVRGESLAAGMSAYLITQLGATPNMRVGVTGPAAHLISATGIDRRCRASAVQQVRRLGVLRRRGEGDRGGGHRARLTHGNWRTAVTSRACGHGRSAWALVGPPSGWVSTQKESCSSYGCPEGGPMKPNPAAPAAPSAPAAPAAPRAIRPLVFTLTVMLLAAGGSAAATRVADGPSASTASPPAAPSSAASLSVAVSTATTAVGPTPAPAAGTSSGRGDRGSAVGARTV